MRIQSSVLVHLGFGKYVRSDQVTAVLPIDEERGPGRRTFVHVQGQTDPIIASRAEDSIVRDLVQEPREVTQSRQQQEILHDLLLWLSAWIRFFIYSFVSFYYTIFQLISRRSYIIDLWKTLL